MSTTRRVVLWWLLFALVYTNAAAFSLFPTRRGDGSTVFQRGRKPPEETEPEVKDASEGRLPHFVPVTHGAKKPATKPHEEDGSKEESTRPKTVLHVPKKSSPDVVSLEKKVVTTKPGDSDGRASAKKAPAIPSARSAVESISSEAGKSASTSAEGKSRAAKVPAALHGDAKVQVPSRRETEHLTHGSEVAEEEKPCLQSSGESTELHKELSTPARKRTSTEAHTATTVTTDTKSIADPMEKTVKRDCTHVSGPGHLPEQVEAESKDSTVSESGVSHSVPGDNVRFGPRPALHVGALDVPSKENATSTREVPAEDSARQDANLPSFSQIHIRGSESFAHISGVKEKEPSSPEPSMTPLRSGLSHLPVVVRTDPQPSPAESPAPAPLPAMPSEPPYAPVESPAPQPAVPSEPPQSPAESPAPDVIAPAKPALSPVESPETHQPEPSEPSQMPVETPTPLSAMPSEPPQSPEESPAPLPAVPSEPPQSPAETPAPQSVMTSEPPQSPAETPAPQPAMPSDPPQSPAETPATQPVMTSDPPQSPAETPATQPVMTSEPPQSPAETPATQPAVPSDPSPTPEETPAPQPAVPSDPSPTPEETPAPQPAMPSEPPQSPAESPAPHLPKEAESPAPTSEGSGESSDTSKASPEPSAPPPSPEVPAPSPSDVVDVSPVSPSTSPEPPSEPKLSPAIIPLPSQPTELDTEEQLVEYLQKRFQDEPGVTVGAKLSGNKKVGLLVEEGAQITLEHVTIRPMPDIDVIVMVTGGHLKIENVKIEAAPPQTVLRRSLKEPAAEVKTGLEVADGAVVHIENGTFEAATDTMVTVRGNSFFQCSNCIFRSNKGSRGGAVMVEDSEAEFVNCQMINNEAVTGGSVHFEAGSAEAPTEHKSTLTIKHSDFENNRATEKGASIFALRAKDIIFSKTTFNDGTAKNGAAAWIEDTQKFEVIASKFERNQAKSSGGAVYTKAVKTLHVKDSNFDNNRALTGLGGAVFAYDPQAVMLSDSSFGSNSAAGGGALGFHEHFSEAGRLDIARSRFTNNNADDRGGALLLQRASRNEIEPQAELIKVDNVVAAISETTFDNNVAMGSGGAIFVTSNSGEAYNLQVTLKTTSFTLNRAREGSCLYCGEHTTMVLPESIFDENRDRDGSNSVSHCHCQFNALSGRTDSSRTSSYDMKTVKQNCLLETPQPAESVKEQNSVWLFVCIAMAVGFVFCALAALFIVKYRKRMQNERTSGIYHRSLSTCVGPARSQSILSQPFYEDLEDEDAPLAGPSVFGNLTGAESLDHDLIMQREQSETLAHAMSADQAFVESALWEQKPLIPPAIHRLNSISEYASEAP